LKATLYLELLTGPPGCAGMDQIGAAGFKIRLQIEVKLTRLVATRSVDLQTL